MVFREGDNETIELRRFDHNYCGKKIDGANWEGNTATLPGFH